MAVLYRPLPLPLLLLLPLLFISAFARLNSVSRFGIGIGPVGFGIDIGGNPLDGSDGVASDLLPSIPSSGDDQGNDEQENPAPTSHKKEKKKKKKHHKKNKKKHHKKHHVDEDFFKIGGDLLPGAGDNDDEPEFLGSWKLDSENAGVSAMQLQLMPNNKVVWYDTTLLGPSGIKHNPPFCQPVPGDPKKTIDCFAHAVEYDPETAQVRTMKLETDTWCSSGGLSPDGNLVSTGGFQLGFKAVRILGHQCENCEFEENPHALGSTKWYASQQILEDGSFVVLGGRGEFNYEIIPFNTLQFKTDVHDLPWLKEVADEKENTLYPFVFLLPDGNLFVFANDKAIILNPRGGEIVRHLPDLTGGSRNYPASGMSVLLPIKLEPDSTDETVEPEVLVCGGNTHDAFKYSENEPRVFFPALKDCGRIRPLREDAEWEKEDMPTGRVMGDMLLLPTGDVLIINGAKAGTAAWLAAEDPNFTPVLYSPDKEKGQRFKELAPTEIPRLYHSSSALLPDGQILVTGSNPNQFYQFNLKYNTELRVEKFAPPYLAPELEKHRAEILEDQSDKELMYGQDFNVYIKLDAGNVDEADVKVTLYAPPFTTHGFSQNQRLIILSLSEVTNEQITAKAPPSGKIAPPGYYILFVVHRGVPSKGMWVQILLPE